MIKDVLLQKAFEAMENSYAPYSNYHVGAAVMTASGRVFKGTNVENASYGATNCAERSALFAAYSEGVRKEDIVAVAIVSDGDRVCAPCGICRQVICELVGEDVPLYLSNGDQEVEMTIRKLLPMQFVMEDVIR